MAWVKLDDHFFRNPKVVAAGRDARDLYLAGLCYCGSGLTDGVIPIGAIRMLGADADIDNPNAAADALVNAGLWERTAGGYAVHDYLEYNPTKERVLATRAVRSEAGSKGGKQRASNLLEAELTFATENLQAKSNPVPSRPTPVDDLDPEEGANAPSAREKEPAAFVAFMDEYPKGHASRAKCLTVWKRVARKENHAAIMAGLAAWKECGRWKRGYIVAGQTWLAEKRWNDPPPMDDKPLNGRDPNANILQPGTLTPETAEEQAARRERVRQELAKRAEAEGTAHERWQRKQQDAARSAIPRS